MAVGELALLVGGVDCGLGVFAGVLVVGLPGEPRLLIPLGQQGVVLAVLVLVVLFEGGVDEQVGAFLIQGRVSWGGSRAAAAVSRV